MTNLTLIAAIMAIESGGNDLARGRHGEVGSMQVTRAVVVDVNRHHGTAFTLRSMTNRVAAQEVFNRYLWIYATPSRLGRPVSDEDRARIWNGGPNGWRSRSTLPYLRRYRKEVAS
jgi:hypothetical protein